VRRKHRRRSDRRHRRGSDGGHRCRCDRRHRCSRRHRGRDRCGRRRRRCRARRGRRGRGRWRWTWGKGARELATARWPEFIGRVRGGRDRDHATTHGAPRTNGYRRHLRRIDAENGPALRTGYVHVRSPARTALGDPEMRVTPPGWLSVRRSIE